MFGALRPTLVKSLRYPPGGDRDELVWSDNCSARQEEGPRSWREERVQEKSFLRSPRLYPYFT